MSEKKYKESWTVRLVSLPIRAYQYFLSPLLGPHCRFHPTCSSYFLQAINEQGVLRGGYLGIKRLLKCHPGHAGGYDPVPKQADCKHQRTSNKASLHHCKNQHSEINT